jgi:hypothetical protein
MYISAGVKGVITVLPVLGPCVRSHYILDSFRQLISEDDTFVWLSRGYQKAENEITAAQNQPGLTNKIACRIL